MRVTVFNGITGSDINETVDTITLDVSNNRVVFSCASAETANSVADVLYQI